VTFIKQENNGKRTKKREAEPAPTDYRAEYIEANDSHSRCVEEALDGLASVVSTYVTQARNGDNGSGLYSDPRGYPVKVQLSSGSDEDDCTIWVECEALERIATAFERIADALTAKAAS